MSDLENLVQQDPQPAVAEKPAEQARNTDLETNIVRLRQEKERMAREMEELKRMVQAQQQQQAPVQEDNIGIADDDYVSGAHLKNYVSEVKKLKSQLQETQQKSYVQNTHAMLRAEFPDFAAVVSQENFEKLRAREPQLAATLEAGQDLYNVGAATYRAIKSLGLLTPPEVEEDRKRIEDNLAKPKPANAGVGRSSNSPIQAANDFATVLTKEAKEARYRQILAKAKVNY